MSMPTKGKHHHLNHHHQQPHSSHFQSQHIISLNINQPTVPSVSHTAHSQHYNPAVINNTSRFVSHSGSDFHVSGQNFGVQPGGQVASGTNAIGVQSGRGPSLGSIQSISHTAPGISPSGQSQTPSGSSIQSQSSQNSSISTAVGHNQSSQDMGKPTHLQTPTVSMQQIFVQNVSRPSSQQNYYSSGTRSLQPRNNAHRSAPTSNQTQVVGIPGVGNTGGQPTTIYPHPSITMQPSTMYVQGQVSGLHTSPHQQNVYSINNQISMPYTNPPQRHQSHQTQFQYQSYQTHHLLTSNLFGYTHGAQHPGFFFHQPTNAQLNLNRTGPNSVNTGNQHLSASLTNNPGQAIVSQGGVQQNAQQTQTIHALNIPLSQTDVYSGFNSGIANVSCRSKKPRTKAITDIVNPTTGKNISDEIYKDEATVTTDASGNREIPLSSNCNVEVVADFAARVAKLASESPTCSISEIENPSVSSQTAKQITTSIQKISTDCSSVRQYENQTANLTKSIITINDEKENIFNSDSQYVQETTSVISNNSILDNIFIVESDLINPIDLTTDILCKNDSTSLSDRTVNINKNTDIIVPPIDNSLMHKDIDKDCEGEMVTVITMPTLQRCNHDDDSYHHKKDNANTKYFERDTEKNDHHKLADGKIMQKQKNRNKVKSREVINRKGNDKDISDMDAILDPIQIGTSSVKIESKQDVALPKEKEAFVELMKDIKEKDNYECKKENDVNDFHFEQIENNASAVEEPKEKITITEKDIPIKNKNNKDIDLEDHNITMPPDIDRITVFRAKIDSELVQSIVAHKNEENSKVSGLCLNPKEDEICRTDTNLTTSIIKATPSLKYTYSDDQWSPLNTSGKKVYGREFLMKLQSDPNSKIKPLNLPDLDVVLKDSTKTRSPLDHRFKDSNPGRHDVLFPGFVKPSLNAKVPPSNKKSHSGKPKAGKPNVIHVSLSLREDVKLRESENAWKPTRLIQGSRSEEQSKTEALYKRVRSVLNKLTPQKFDTLVNQVRELKIDTQERLQGVIDLVFEKAVDEPNFSEAYALMCKELSNMEVTGADTEDSSSANFRKLILTRCQTEFEKNTVDENARSEKLREIDECSDPEKKKELQMNFDDDERRIRVKSVGNIRFIGELFKQNMLTCKIMHQCIRHLLVQVDEENLECLCKLLTTIGKVLEAKHIDLSEHFKQMQQIANQKGKISSRIRFMLQDVIDLRMNKWIPRRDDSNPKTMDQIQKEAEFERMDSQLINSSVNTPRKDERTNERKRNRGGTGSLEEGGWSQPVGRPRQQPYSVETSKLKGKPPAMDDMQLGSRSNYMWKTNPKMTTSNKYCCLENVPSEPDKRVPSVHLSGSRSTGPRDYGRLEYKTSYDGRNPRNGSYSLTSTSYNRDTAVIEASRSQSMSLSSAAKSASQTIPAINILQLSDEEFQKALNNFIEEYISGEEDLEEAVKGFRTIFPASLHTSFIHEIINLVLEKSDHHRTKTSQVLAQLLSHNCISLPHFKKGLEEIFESAGDLIIDIPKLWKYFAKILVHPLINNAYSLTELRLLPKSRNNVYAIELVAEVLTELTEIQGRSWVSENWIKSGLHWNDFVDDRVKIDKIIIDYKLDFLIESNPTSFEDNTIWSFEKIQNEMLLVLKDGNFDDICRWIQANIGNKTKEPKFIRALMTAILETSVEQCNDKWAFKVENFDKLQKLIQRYVDADDFLELQCLFAVQAYIHKLSHPAGLLLKIMTYLYENNVLSNEAFLSWEKNEDPAEREGKSVARVTLNSFFIPLKEVDDISSGEEA